MMPSEGLTLCPAWDIFIAMLGMLSLRAKRSNPYRNIKARVDCFVARAPRNDAIPIHSFAFSRRDAPELCKNLPPEGGAGNAGCPLHPQPRARSVVSTRVSHHGRTGTPGIPARDGVTAYFVLSPVIGLCCHRRRRDASIIANLTPTLRRQDHTTSPSACKRSRQSRHPRPSHPNPTFVTIAKRPSVVGRDGEGCRSDLGQK